MPRVVHLLIVTATLVAATSTASAQLTPIPAPAPPSYGYQAYDPARGFYHPHDMGYGRYVNPTRQKGHRSPALTYRRFKGY